MMGISACPVFLLDDCCQNFICFQLEKYLALSKYFNSLKALLMSMFHNCSSSYLKQECGTRNMFYLLRYKILELECSPNLIIIINLYRVVYSRMRLTFF